MLTRPDIKFFCDLDFDPFLFMQDNKKVYGFTIALHEYLETIETLWNTTRGPQHSLIQSVMILPK